MQRTSKPVPLRSQPDSNLLYDNNKYANGTTICTLYLKKIWLKLKSLDIEKFHLLFFFVKQNFVKLWRFDFLNIFLGGDSSLAILKILDSQVSLFEQLICTLVCTMWIVGLIDTVVVYLHSIHGSSPNQLLLLASRPTCSFLGNYKDIRHVKSLHILHRLAKMAASEALATNFLAPWV